MLNWSNGGISLPLPSNTPLPRELWHWLSSCLVLIRNLCYLYCGVCHDPRLRVLMCTWDQGKNTRGNCILIPLKTKCWNQTVVSWSKSGNHFGAWLSSSIQRSATILVPCAVESRLWDVGLNIILCNLVAIFCIMLYFDICVDCDFYSKRHSVFIYVRYDDTIEAAGAEPLHGGCAGEWFVHCVK